RRIGLIDVRAGAKPGSFSGYGSTWGNVDAYGTAFQKGAFADTLAAWRARAKLPKMLLQHGGWGLTAEDMLPAGQYTKMEEDAKGLRVEGQLFAMSTDRGQMIYEGLTSGELDGLSVGFVPKKWIAGDGESEPLKTFTAVDLWECSIVTFPANDAATVDAARDMPASARMSLMAELRNAGLPPAEAERALAAINDYISRSPNGPELRDYVRWCDAFRSKHEPRN
ncbi:MAG: HK97 family phage prohead protease, partial [Alphaproteobacteria bacterium]